MPEKGMQKSMENDAKMESEWRQKSLETFENMRTNACQKSMLKFDAEKSARDFFHSRFWIDFWSGLGGLGGG